MVGSSFFFVNISCLELHCFDNQYHHYILALQEKALQDLVALATLYYTTQVARQARGTKEAKRRDLSRFLAFSYDPFRHYHPRHIVNPTS